MMSFDLILKEASLPIPIRSVPLDGGANNRVYKLEFQTHSPLICKQYFQDSKDLRQRLQAEYSFLIYAWRSGLRNIPQPIFAHPATNTALYSFLPGRRFDLQDVTDSCIYQAIDFFLKLNQKKAHGSDLPVGSESCFSLMEYLQVTERRIEALRNVCAIGSLQAELSSFLHSALYPKWIRIQKQICKTALHDRLLLEDQCISPSDFGFHNALLDRDGTLNFIDFEYAGWDDPCKMVCDFFCQPKVPIPPRYFKLFSEAVAFAMPNPEKCLKRIEIIFPVMQIKWCCILLNTFTQVGKNRRLFSSSEEVDQQEKQLLRAKQLFDTILV